MKGVASGKSVHRAALDVGYSPHTARSDVYKAGPLRKQISRLMARRGLTDDLLLDKLEEALSAVETRLVVVEGRIKRCALADHPVRLRALEIALKLRDAFPSKEDAEEQRRGGPIVAIQINEIPSAGQGSRDSDNGKGDRVLGDISFRTTSAKDDVGH